MSPRREFQRIAISGSEKMLRWTILCITVVFLLEASGIAECYKYESPETEQSAVESELRKLTYAELLDYAVVRTMRTDVPILKPASVSSVNAVDDALFGNLSLLYSETGGYNWAVSTGWLSSSPICSWFGITCVNSSIVSIRLANNNLFGSLPMSLFLPSTLLILDLSYNSLYGDLPEWLLRLSSLQTLDIRLNSFSGAPPMMPSLSQLCLEGNDFSGQFPVQITTMTALQVLYMGGQFITGSIPLSMSTMRNLQQLGFRDMAMISGSFPSALSTLSNLNLLTLKNLALTGTLPTFIQTLPLQSLELSNLPWITGALPVLSSVAQLSYLKLNQLEMSGSLAWVSDATALTNLQLIDLPLVTGSLPSFQRLSNLVAIVLDALPFNGTLRLPALMPEFGFLNVMNLPQLSGSLPVFQAPMLQALQLYGNALSGSIPVQYSTFTAVKFVLLQNNQLSGSLPAQLASWSGVMDLQVDNNQLSGSLPEIYSQLSNLITFTISNNQLNGTLPCSSATFDTQAWASLTIFDISGNQFSGPLDTRCFDEPIVFIADDNQFTEIVQAGLDASSGDLYVFTASNNSLQGPLPDFSTVSNTLATLDLSMNPQLSVPCNRTGTEASECFGNNVFRLEPSTVKHIYHPIVMDCMDITSTIRTLSLSVDISVLGYAQCFCAFGYFQQNTSVATNVSCLPCSSQCLCMNGRATGCYPTPHEGLWEYMVPCPMIGLNETACTNGTLSQLSPLEGPVPRPLFSCVTGYLDRLCSRCDVRYYASQHVCVQCASYAFWLLPVGYVVSLALVLVYLLRMPGTATGVLKIALSYLQTTLILVKNSGLGWLHPFSAIVQHASNTASFSFAAVECVIPGISIVGRYSVYVSVPVILMAVAVTVYIVGRLIRGSNGVPLFWRQRCVYVALFLLSSTYFDLAVKVFLVFGCTLYDPGNGLHYLSGHPYIACDAHNGSYSALLGIAITALLLFIIGIPTMVGRMLWRARATLADPATITQCGFLYACYGTNTFWWEGVLVLRRLILAAILAVVPFTQPQVAVIVVFLVLQVSTLLQHAFSPFRTRLENRLELATLYTLLVSFLVAFISTQTDLTGSGYDAHGILLAVMVVNVIFSVVLLLLVVLTFLVQAVGVLQWVRTFVELAVLDKLEIAAVHLKERLLQDQHLDDAHKL